MEIFSEAIPHWVAIVFLLVMPVPIYMIANLTKKGVLSAGFKKAKATRLFWMVLGFFLLFTVYVFIAAVKGLFLENMLPPKILILSTIPLLVFLVLIVSNLPVYKTILRNLRLSDLVRLHIFRLMGTFFLILTFYGALPTVFALIAGIGDLTTALSSIWVSRVLDQEKSYAKPLAIAWNTFGLLDILATSGTAFMLTKLSIETGSQGVNELANFPYCFIPAFAPATIIFLHFTVYKKILSN